MEAVATGFIGIYSFELLFPESHSLKDKRMHLRSVKAIPPDACMRSA